ncbi:MAG: hypothetical protein KAX18_05395, partial [Candidatus Lokiarchaeota archaeon]|nr:hypothetical protein [Candidatus Lokiarchaeota archaeon]
DIIHVREDTRTHKIGDLVTVKQAAVLKKLGITPIESLIKIHFAWSDGGVVPIEILYMDVEEFKRDVAMAYNQALGIAFEMPFYVENIAEDYIRKAASEANTLEAIIFGEGISVPAESKPKVEEKEKETEEEPKEEVGIGGLFG